MGARQYRQVFGFRLVGDASKPRFFNQFAGIARRVMGKTDAYIIGFPAAIPELGTPSLSG